MTAATQPAVPDRAVDDIVERVTWAGICPTCRQPVPGMTEPPDIGTIVSCSCGDAFSRLAPASDPRVTGVWRRVTSGQAGRMSWLKVLTRHREHALTVVHVPPRPSDGETR